MKSVRELERFLRRSSENFWADKLATAAESLETGSMHKSARIELDSYFGGMGSLNDLAFPDDTEQKEFGRLADEVFKHNKLLTVGFRDRLRWHLYERSHKDDLSPRIVNSFAK